MKDHPNRELMARYVCAESSPSERKLLEAHVSECPQCSSTLEEWQKTLTALNAWKLPAGRKTEMARPWLVYAAAACLMIGIGFAVGRFSVPAGLQKEEVAQMIAAEKTAIYKDMILALENSRMEERQLTSLIIGQLREDQAYKLVQLRKDLETVATGADAGLRQTQLGLIQLSAFKQEQQ